MVSLLSNLVNIVAEGIREIKCKYGHDNKKSETCGIKYKDCVYCLEYTDVKDDFIEYKSLFCKKSYQKKFDENLKKRVANTYKFFNHGVNKFMFYCCEKVFNHMNTWMIGKNSMKHHYLKNSILSKHGRYC